MEEAQEAQEAQTIDLQATTTAFKPYLEELTLANGETLQLPRLTAKKIIATGRSVAKLIKAISQEMPQLTIDPTSPKASIEIVTMIFEVLPSAMEHVVPVVADYLGRPAVEIEEWDGEDVISVAGIFFLNSLKSGNTLLSRLGLSPQNFVNFAQPLAPSTLTPGPSAITPSSTPLDSSPPSSTPSPPTTDGDLTIPLN